MSITVCLSASTIAYPEGGGHLWVFLNWALGLRSLGCKVVWLEGIGCDFPPDRVAAHTAALKARLERYGLADHLALWFAEPHREMPPRCLDLEEATEADLLLNLRYDTPAEVVGRFRRSVLLDIDPGLLQIWMSQGQIRVAPHDLYFTTGETVGRPEARFPDAGLSWHYTPPCVALDCWPPHPAPPGAPFTTVSHWFELGWVQDAEGWYQNDKHAGFLPFLELPRITAQPLELALCLGSNEESTRRELEALGWRVRHSHTVTATPWDYQRYIQDSRGEFSCVKPSCVRLANAWISDRTLCYLASGKPAVIQHTGPSRFLPEAAGLFRFRDLNEAARCLEKAAGDAEHQGRLARALAEEFFAADKVGARLLERALA